MLSDDNNDEEESVRSMMSRDDNDSDSNIDEESYPWSEHFEDFCASNDLSIEKMRWVTEGASSDDLRGSTFLHRVCLNSNVTYEIVQYLIELFPEAVNYCLDSVFDDIRETYPIHLACFNEDCPNEVIRLLVRGGHHKHMMHMTYTDFAWGNTDAVLEDSYGGLPLHYYLSRTSNLDLDIIKLLLDIYPKALAITDQGLKRTPFDILLSNESIEEMYDVVKFLVESNPVALRKVNSVEDNALHLACRNNNITARVIEVLLRAFPEATRQRNSIGEFRSLPIHCLCENTDLDDTESVDALKLLLHSYPDSAMKTENVSNDEHFLPIHIAAKHKSAEFCKVLVNAFPESARMADSDNSFPVHCACDGRAPPNTLEYLFGLYPGSIHKRNNIGYLPIHEACSIPIGVHSNKIIDFLLSHDPKCVSKPVVSSGAYNGHLPLHVICNSWDRGGITKKLFDIYPEAILHQNHAGKTPIEVLREEIDGLPVNDRGLPYNEEFQTTGIEIIAFLQKMHGFAGMARTQNLMGDRDYVMYLHDIIREGSPLGAIKLLFKQNPNIINSRYDSDGIYHDGIYHGMMLLETACYHSTSGVVKFLREYHTGSVKIFPLHHACRGGNHEVVKYLLDNPMGSVSEKDNDGKLPIRLFCEYVKGLGPQEEGVEDIKCTEVIWLLLSAYPETVLNW